MKHTSLVVLLGKFPRTGILLEPLGPAKCCSKESPNSQHWRPPLLFITGKLAREHQIESREGCLERVSLAGIQVGTSRSYPGQVDLGHGVVVKEKL